MPGCSIARDVLDGRQPIGMVALEQHILLCPTCEAFFTEREAEFRTWFRNDSLQDLSATLDEALSRLRQTGLAPGRPRPREVWSTPDIPGFTRERLLGETRHARVYLARQTSLDRPVALKVVRIRPGSRSADTLKNEAATLASLQHPNIVTIHETGLWEHGLWLALEYCEGGDLLHRLRGPWPQRDAAHLVREMALASHAAHLKGIIHRDIKPANILFAGGDQPKLGDFGLASSLPGESATPVDPSMAMVGTPSYIAPEQVLGHPCDARTDVHSLGAVLYHLLVGNSPFQGRDSFDSMRLAAHVSPVQPVELNHRISEDLNAICMTCLRKEPDRRYASAGELANDLGRFLEGRPV